MIGGGVVGMTTARELQRRGFDVTIYAATLPPDVTSNWSLAGFTPTSGLSTAAARTPEWTAQFTQAVDIAYRRLQLLIGPRYGISWITNYSPTDDERMITGSNSLLPEHIQGAKLLLGPGEHPFPTEVRHRAARDADRALDLPRGAARRLPDLRRHHHRAEVRERRARSRRFPRA